MRLYKPSKIALATLDAYVNADYWVGGSTPFTLKIDCFSPQLQFFLQHHQSHCAALITAFNPYSQMLTPQQNACADRRLLAELSRRQLTYIEGVSSDPQQQWSHEKSYLILNLALNQSKRLAQQFQQNGLVWSDADAIPRLVLVR